MGIVSELKRRRRSNTVSVSASPVSSTIDLHAVDFLCYCHL